jgi:hypothetical protein
MLPRPLSYLMIAAFWPLGAAPAAAQSPVAIVEQVESRSAGVEFMDYVFPGQVIRLGDSGSMILSYLSSCWRERILAGTITIGQEQSDVKGGTVQRARVNCSSGGMQLSAEQAKQSGGMSFRGGPRRTQGKELNVLTLHGMSPVFELDRPGKLIVERIDEPGEKIDEDITNDMLLRGAFYDFARSNRALAPGGVYRVRHDGRQIIFRIAVDAEPGAAAVTTRLVRLPKN